MKKTYQSEKILLFSYFLSIIFCGAILLYLPASWGGPKSLSFIDSFFTSISAVCVTGLITVDTSSYSLMGQIIILVLIQAGGLGIISFTTIYLARPSRKISLIKRSVIRGYYLDSVEYEPISIIKKIIIMTFVIEGLGTVLLFQTFQKTIGQRSFLFSIFHAVSAFCNAGFSLFPNSLTDYVTDINLNLTIIGLIVLGGLGFVVLQDIQTKIFAPGRKKRILLHTKIVFFMTFCLIFIAAIFYLFFEYQGTLKLLNLPQKIVASLFQAVTPRTAGFNTLKTSALASPSKILTIFLMFTGGASGSVAGGIKVTTFFVVLLMTLQRPDSRGEVTIFKRKISAHTMYRAIMFMIKALLILFCSIFLLTITEMWIAADPGKSFFAIVFECFSAFGTVGLSLGITPDLSAMGKLVIIMTMFLGRVGLMALAIPPSRHYPVHILDHPVEEVMIG